MPIINTTPALVGGIIKEISGTQGTDQVVKDIQVQGHRLIFTYGDSGRINIIKVDNTALPIDQTDKSVSIDLSGKADVSDLTAHTGNSNIHVTTADKSAWNAKYKLPPGGIPKSDLASDVQTSLDKADTALQSHQDISGKSDVGHTHAISDVTNLQSSLNAKLDDSQLKTAWSSTTSDTNIPSEKLVKATLDGKAPTFTVETTGSGNAVTAVSYANNKITATKGATYNNYTHPSPTRTNTTSTASPAHGGTVTVVDSVTSDTSGHVTGVNTKTITLPADNNTDTLVAQVLKTDNYDRPLLMSDQIISTTTVSPVGEARRNNSIYANTSTGKITSTLIDATQVGGMTKTYTTGANTTRVILARVNNYAGLASCRIKLEVGPDTSSGAKVVYIDAIWTGRGARMTIKSVYDWNNAMRYFYIVCPNNTSYYTSNPPEIHLSQTTAVARTVKATILERSGEVVLMDNLTTAGNTTNRNSYTYDINNTVGIYDNTGYVQNSGWAGGAWDRLDNDRYLYGEACVNTSIVARASDGKLWKLSHNDKEFLLPLDIGNCPGTFAVNASWGRVCRSIRGLGWANFTNANSQGTAFTVPTLTVSDYGKTVYLVGTLSNGNFKSNRTISLSMDVPSSGSLTYIPIGKIDHIAENVASAVPTTWTLDAYNANAYTIDSNGKLTHINGKDIRDTLYTPASSVTAVGTTAVTGTSTNYARQDHVHNIALATGDNNGQVKIAGSNVSVKGLGDAAYKAVETTLANDAKLPTGAAVKTYVDTAINALPGPMVFKGTLGPSGATAFSLPHPVRAEGDVYKCISAGTFTWSTNGSTDMRWPGGGGAGGSTGSGSGSGITYTEGEVTFEVGDMLVSNGSEWVLVPSGDEPSGTVTSVGAGTGLQTNVSGGGPIVESGSLSVKYGTTAGTACEGNDSRLTNARAPTAHNHNASDINAGTLDKARLPIATTSAVGAVSVGTGLGVTSAGALSVSYGSAAGTACQGNDSRLSNARTPTAHTHAISDVTNLQDALDGKAASDHNHDTAYIKLYNNAVNMSAIAGWGTLTAANGYTHLAGFQQPSGNNNGAAYFASKSGQTSMQIDGFFYQNEGTKKVVDESYASNDNALAIITGSTGASGSSTSYARKDHKHAITVATGDSNGQVKIAGTNVDVKGLGSAAYTESTAYATSGHTHDIILASGGTATVNLAHNTAYTLTAGGKSVVFKTPADNNTTYSAGYKLEMSGTTFNARKCIVGHSGSTLTNTWYKVASLSHSNAHTDYHITFKVWAGYADSSTRMGILSAHIRTNNTGFEGAQLVWEEAQSGIDATHFVLLRNSSGGSFPCNCEIWAYCNTSWQAYHFDVLSEGNRAGFSKPWTLYTNVRDDAVSGQVGTAYTTGMTAQNSTFGTLKNVATPASHTHNYAGSSEAGGAATTALACTGNAATATTLQTTRSINGTNFNGSANITTSKWGTARNITISDNDGTNTQATNSIDGSANFTLKLPATIKASLTGTSTYATYLSIDNGATTTTASKSSWTGGRPNSEDVRAWSQKWVNTSLGSDSGDINIWLHKVSSSSVTANLAIDGQIYAMSGFSGNLTGNVTGNCSGSSGSCTGNAATATTALACTGNAATATAFSANKSVALTGDVTGSASSTGGWSVATTLAASGVTAGSYGPSANASPNHGAKFNVPYITVDGKGRVTAASTKEITLPTVVDPMIFKGSVGTNGTITALTAAAAANKGYVYKAITDHAASTNPVYPAYKAGDTLISDGSAWTVIPSGDEPSGTVTSVATGTDLTGGTITTSGTIKHADITRTDTTSAASPAHSGSFTVVDSVTTNARGHVTAVNIKTVTLPASGNTDANVKQTLKATSDTGTYPIILKNSTTKTDSPTAGTNYVAAVYVKPSAGEITATNFAGKHSGYTLGAACAKGVDTTVTTGSTNLVTSGGVATALANYQTAGSYAAASHTHTTAEVTACTGYTAGSDATLAAGDTLNGALGKAQGQISALKNHNYETYKTAASVASNGLDSLTSGFRYITSYAILGKTSNWMIESISSAAGGYVMQRATDFADPSNVCIRTKNGSSASWSTWTYSYAVWKV